MKTQNRWRKFLSSTPVIIVYQTITGLILLKLFLSSTPGRDISWTNAIAISVFYGIISTIAIKTKVDKYVASLGLSRPEQSIALAESLKKGEVPTDKELRDAMPAYLADRKKTIDKNTRFLPVYFLLFGFMLLGSIINRLYLEAAIFIGILVFGIYSFQYRAKKTERNIADLQKKLGIHDINLDTESIAEDDKWNFTKSNAKNIFFILCGIVLVLLIVILAVSSNKNNNDNSYQANTLKNTSPQRATSFISTKYNFKIDFPGKPAQTNDILTPDCGKADVKYTDFDSSSDDDTQVYDVFVYSWPKQDVDFSNMTKPALKATLNNFAKEAIENNGANPVNTKINELYLNNGRTLAEEARIIIPEKDYTVYGYVRVFTIGNNEYDLLVQDSGGRASKDFANSFQYVSNGAAMPINNGGGTIKTVCVTPNNGNVSNYPTGQEDNGNDSNENTGNSNQINGNFSTGPTDGATLTLQ